MRFRRKEWDIEMPPALVTYWQMWNSNDESVVRSLANECASADIEWVDPRDHFVGRDELVACVMRLRTSKPHYEFAVVSAIDSHHDRLRYRWDMTSRSRNLMQGIDIMTTDADGRISVVEGFFGEPTPLDAHA